MHTIKNLFLVILCCVFIGCANQTQQNTQNVDAQNSQAVTGLKWTSKELEGNTWQLLDENRIENMSFLPNGYLSITLGVKTASGSTIRAPIYLWSIASDGALVITDNQNNIFEKLYKVKVDDKRVTVQLNGKVQVYDKLK